MRKYRLAYALFLITLTAAAAAQPDLPFHQTKDVPCGPNVVMDVFTPTGKGLLPVYNAADQGKGLAIIDIASGGWSSDRGKINDHLGFKLYHILCARGYVVFAVRPGSMPDVTGLEMLQNIQTAIRFVKSKAKDYRIDPNRIGLMGASAGGHLTCLTVVNETKADPAAADPLMRQNTRIKAACAFFPPTDFLNWDGDVAPLDLAAELFFKGGIEGRSDKEITAAAKELSPIYKVKPGLPPMIFFHGDADPLVPLQQSQDMVKALTKAGNEASLIVKKGGGHPWLTLSMELIDMADWFDKQLRKP